jgi:chemotaxis protein histidine kinase CheA
MDDLLKVFLGETAECLAACWIAVDELRENPGDSAALVELLRQVRTVQETSRFLGMASLNAAASLTLESLESATARRPASIDRIVPIAVDGLQRVEEIIRAIADGEVGTVRHSIRTESASSPRSGAIQPEESGARSQSRPKKPSATENGPPGTPRQLRSNDALLADLVAAAGGANGADAAPNGEGNSTVRVSADTLNYLLSTVRELVDAQAEMMRRLNAKDAGPERPVAPASSAVAEPPEAAAPAAISEPAGPVSTASPVQALGTAAPGMIRVLLFRDAGGVSKAVALDRVARLEEVDLKAVDHDRGLWVMRSGNDLLPLVPFDPACRLPPTGRAPVIVFTIDRDSFGLLVESVPEVADVAPSPARDTVLLDGQAIEMIEPARYLERTIRARFERRRADRKRAPSADDHRIVLSERDDLFVRKPLR